MKWLAAIAVVAVLAPLKGHAQNTSNDYLEFCKHAADPKSVTEWQDFIDGGRCPGYLEGWNNAEAVYAKRPYGAPPTYCQPLDAVTITQKALIWVKYLEDHPEELHLVPAITYFSSMLEAFPCP